MARTDQLDNPLPETRYKEINTALGLILKARDLANKVAACGVDVSGDIAYLDGQEALFNEWKNQFFQNRR